jgi:hypothetical protein
MKKKCDFSKMKEPRTPYTSKKQAVGINLSPEVVDYFKGLADETGPHWLDDSAFPGLRASSAISFANTS